MLEHEAASIRAALELRGYRVETWELFTAGELRLVAWRPNFPAGGPPHVCLNTIDQARDYIAGHCRRCDVRLTAFERAQRTGLCYTCALDPRQIPFPYERTDNARV